MTYQLEAFLHRVEAKLREVGGKMEKAEYFKRPNAMVKHRLVVFSLEAARVDLISAIEHLREAGV